MKRRRTRVKACPPEHPGQAMEHSEGQTSDMECMPVPSHDQPEDGPDVDDQATPEGDVEAAASEAPPAQDQQAVHEDCADEWLDAAFGTEPPGARRSDLQRE